MYGLLADVVVAVHFAYVAFVVLGQVLILAGLVWKWHWVRNLWFRLAHLIAILIVTVESILNITCPLTLWEYQLRRLGGQAPRGESFIGRLLNDLMFFNFQNEWLLTAIYIGFGLLVLATFVLVPPMWRSPQVGGRPQAPPLGQG
jgi:hypothetical protein